MSVNELNEMDSNPEWVGHYSPETVDAAWEAFHAVIHASPERPAIEARAERASEPNVRQPWPTHRPAPHGMLRAALHRLRYPTHRVVRWGLSDPDLVCLVDDKEWALSKFWKRVLSR